MSQSNSSNHSESEDEDQKKDQLGEEIIDDQNEMESKIKNTANVANLDRDKKKQHFYTINPDEDFKMVKLKVKYSLAISVLSCILTIRENFWIIYSQLEDDQREPYFNIFIVQSKKDFIFKFVKKLQINKLIS